MGFNNLSEGELGSHVGKRIRAARIRAGLTPFDVIEATGMSKSSYYSYETGQGIFSLGNLHKIVRAVGCTLSELLRNEEDEERLFVADRLDESIAKARHLLSLIMADERRTARLGDELMAALGKIQQLSSEARPKPGGVRCWSEEIAASEGVKRRHRK